MFGVEPSEIVDERNEDGVAALLRRRREELGRDVATVARQLRIRAIYIQAIEEGRLQDLPGTAYAVGFVRAYADYLGLDGNSIVSDYRDELARRSRQNQLIWPVDQVEHKHFPGSTIVVVCLVLVAALYGGWYFVSQPGGTGIDLIDQVPEFMRKQSGETAEEAPAPAESGAASGDTPTTAQAASAPESAAPAETAAASVPAAMPANAPATPMPSAEPATGSIAGSLEPAPAVATAMPAASPIAEPAATPVPATPPVSATTEGAAPSAPAATDSAAVAPAPAAAGDAATSDAAAPIATTPAIAEPATQAAALPDATTNETAAAENPVAASRIVLRAAKDSWVEIFDAEEKVVLQRILRAGESYAVPDQAGLVMNTGNAGGLVIELDGRAQPSLGSVGVVKRGIKLEPGALVEP
jgi:cytoskeleton protein RodZ